MESPADWQAQASGTAGALLSGRIDVCLVCGVFFEVSPFSSVMYYKCLLSAKESEVGVEGGSVTAVEVAVATVPVVAIRRDRHLVP